MTRRRSYLPGLTIPVVAFALDPAPLQAQDAGRTLRGHVVSSDGMPVVGAEIRIDGASAVATSDNSGRFEIPLVQERTRVQVRAIGYTSLDTVLVSRRLDGAHIRIARCVATGNNRLAVFLNGQRLGNFGAVEFLAELKTTEIETMDVYRGPFQLPLEAMGDACAAVLVNTRYTTGSVLTNK